MAVRRILTRPVIRKAVTKKKRLTEGGADENDNDTDKNNHDNKEDKFKEQSGDEIDATGGHESNNKPYNKRKYTSNA